MENSNRSLMAQFTQLHQETTVSHLASDAAAAEDHGEWIWRQTQLHQETTVSGSGAADVSRLVWPISRLDCLVM